MYKIPRMIAVKVHRRETMGSKMRSSKGRLQEWMTVRAMERSSFSIGAW